MRKSMIPAVIYCIFIFFLSSQQELLWVSRAEEQTIGFKTSSFFKHIVEYAILGGLLRIASNDLPSIFMFSVFYGVTDEIHQWFVPLRVLSPYDMLANSIGGLLGLSIVHYIVLNSIPTRAADFCEKGDTK